MNKPDELLLGIRKVEKHLTKAEYDESIAVCTKLLNEHPGNHAVIRAMADTFALMGNIAESIDTRTEILRSGNREPADLYDLARHSIDIGNNDSAIDWCKEGISICEEVNNNYYLNALRFYLTLGLLNTSRYEEAQLAAQLLPTDYEAHMRGHGMRTQPELLKAAEDGSARFKKKIFKFEDDNG